jgi:hypothetical protein
VLCEVRSAGAAAVDLVSAEVDLEHFAHVCVELSQPTGWMLPSIKPMFVDANLFLEFRGI